MENKVLGIGVYKDSIILIKEGNYSLEYPNNFKSRTRLKFGVFSVINSNLQMDESVPEQIALRHTRAKVQKTLLINPRPVGDVIYYYSDDWIQKHFFFLVFDQIFETFENQEIFLKNSLVNALKKANNKGLDAVVIPGILFPTNRLTLIDAANAYYEAVEQFIDENFECSVKLFCFCLFKEVEGKAFVDAAKLKFQKYESYTFNE